MPSQSPGSYLHSNVLSWNLLLSSSLDHEVFDVYVRMKMYGIEPNCHTFVRLFKACGSEKDVERGRRLHCEVIHSEKFMSDAFLQSTLIRMYSKCGATSEAEEVFCGPAAKRDIVSWNAMLSGYLDRNEGTKALKLYRQLHEQKDVNVNESTVVIIVQVCSMLTQEDVGCSDGMFSFAIHQALHCDIRRKEFASNLFVASALLNMYKKMGAIREMEHTFNGLPQFDVVTCNVMISAYIEDRQVEMALKFYRWMQTEGIHSDERTHVFVLQACGIYAEEEELSILQGQRIKKVPLEIGQALHIDACRRGFATSLFVENVLLSMYGKCGAVREAEQVFRTSRQRDVILCTVMLSVYVENGKATRALLLYRQMQYEGMYIDERSLMFALQACVVLAGKDENSSLIQWRSRKTMALEIGQSLHAYIHKKGFTIDAFLANSLISMYRKSDAILQAEDVFNGFSQHDIALWNALLLAYIDHRKGERALQLYREMQIHGVIPDQVTYCASVVACSIIKERGSNELPLNKLICLEIGAALHSDICKQGFASDSSVCTALIGVYGSCGMISEAEYVLVSQPYPSLALWSAMLSVYTESKQGEKAVELYQEIQKKFKFIDVFTLIRELQACSMTGHIKICRSVHFYVVSSGCDQMHSVMATLIHTYGNCASIADGQAVLNEVVELDIAIWNAFIACHPDSSMVGHIFENLRQEGNEPDDVTFITILILCCHSGFVRKGMECFECMWRDFDIIPSVMHYCAMADLFGRAGNFNEVENILKSMPMQANAVVWPCVLAACRIHGNFDLAREMFDKTENWQSEQSSVYVLLSNICVEIGLHV